MMTESECLAAISNGATATELLFEAIPGVEHHWHKLDRAIIKFLADVRKEFPNAQYYTASGGFNLLLGSPHNAKLVAQQELSALSGLASIGDGDY
jgi:hypothetical protein